ncbi:hypothetical protein BRC77_05935 [Halobacteriales archaeon QH_8_64_26]|nr:MAG: hypothetical protein BRC77_05935 [Halobacteriales archaeon QH_8_64_26]
MAGPWRRGKPTKRLPHARFDSLLRGPGSPIAVVRTGSRRIGATRRKRLRGGERLAAAGRGTEHEREREPTIDLRSEPDQ